MHVVQTLTAIHDRYSVFPIPKRGPSEVYHWSQAAILFNQKLSQPLDLNDRDALWATAALLGVIAFGTIDVSRPEDAWPLKNDEGDDLQWLKMGEGKIAVWNMTDPLRPDSVFAPLSQQYLYTCAGLTQPVVGTKGIPPEFIELCDLTDTSTAKNHDYFLAAHALAPLLLTEYNENNSTRYLAFLSHLTADFKKMLEAKEPRSLVLLAYWYAKMRSSQWFMARRAIFEGQAICMYLGKFHADDTLILKMLRFPESEFRKSQLPGIQ
jgi:hypothetical protein